MRNSGEWDLPICILTHPSSDFQPHLSLRGFPGGSDGKESACSVGDPGLIPGSGSSPGEGNGYSVQCSCPENPMGRRDWWATVLGAAYSWTGLNN